MTLVAVPVGATSAPSWNAARQAAEKQRQAVEHPAPPREVSTFEAVVWAVWLLTVVVLAVRFFARRDT